VASTFYTLQGANRRNSLLLVLAVMALLGVFGFAIGFAWTGALAGALVVTAIAVAVAALLSLVSYYQGDSMVLAASKAREVTAEDEPELINVVREMTIASNLPMPHVYVIEDSAPNAFATGRDPQHASLAVTTGLLNKLDREELQGVIGHELGHVGNYDIRFALLVGVLVGSIALLADVFLRWTWWSGFAGRGRSRGNRDDGGGGAAQLIIVVVAIVLAILAPIFARLVQLAVSRQREYLADATSVEFTRNPAGLERALAKIAEDQEVLEVANRATQHLYIVNPIKKFEERSKGLFSTHPPILDRINRLRALHGAPPVGGAEANALANLD
jgi:heat shock protein HtpX